MARNQQSAAGRKVVKSDLPSRREAREVFGDFFERKGIVTRPFNPGGKAKMKGKRK